MIFEVWQALCIHLAAAVPHLSLLLYHGPVLLGGRHLLEHALPCSPREPHHLHGFPTAATWQRGSASSHSIFPWRTVCSCFTSSTALASDQLEHSQTSTRTLSRTR